MLLGFSDSVHWAFWGCQFEAVPHIMRCQCRWLFESGQKVPVVVLPEYHVTYEGPGESSLPNSTTTYFGETHQGFHFFWFWIIPDWYRQSQTLGTRFSPKASPNTSSHFKSPLPLRKTNAACFLGICMIYFVLFQWITFLFICLGGYIAYLKMLGAATLQYFGGPLSTLAVPYSRGIFDFALEQRRCIKVFFTQFVGKDHGLEPKTNITRHLEISVKAWWWKTHGITDSNFSIKSQSIVIKKPIQRYFTPPHPV